MPVNPEGSFSVPLELFGGLNEDVSPIDLPEGLSPSCQDVVFLPGQVGTRPAYNRLYPAGAVGLVSFIATFERFNGQPLNLLYDQSFGGLYFEDVVNGPGSFLGNKIAQLSPNQMVKAENADDRFWMAFSDGVRGIDIPRYYDAAGNLRRVSQSGPGAAITAAADVTAGSLVAGVHKVCVSFLLSSGYITKPSPLASWTALGTDSVLLTTIPTGTVFAVTGSQVGETVVARILHFTGAGGANFYYIPQPTGAGGTILNDNTTTTVTLTFSDIALFAGIPIDVVGSNLFNLDTLSPCLGFRFYKDRLCAWGRLNKLPNLLNMDFDGGVSGGGPFIPLGWTSTAAGGTVIGATVPNVATVEWQGAWQITGDGTAGPVGAIHQGIYRDGFNAPIALPNTKYSVRFWGFVALAWRPNIAGTITWKISSVATGFATSTSVPVVNLEENTTTGIGNWITLDFPAAMPAQIPSDLILTVSGGGIPNGTPVVIDEAAIYPTLQPLTNDLACSYVNDPESFDLVTGLVAAEYPEQALMDCWEERDLLYFGKSALGAGPGSLHFTSDNGTSEPAGWTVVQISKAIGLISAQGAELGEDYVFLADVGGLYLFNGGEPLKVSQEIQSIWDGINPAAMPTVWVKNDRVARRLYVGIPQGAATVPSAIAVMDYREMKGFPEIAHGDPVHISYAGRVLSTDLSRKWTLWVNRSASCAAVIARPNNQRLFVFGLGTNLNVYWLNPAKFTDDDFGQIPSFYITYFLMSPQLHQAAQMLGLNLYDYLRLKVSGAGTLQVSLYGNDLSNEWPLPPTVPLQAISLADLELGLNVVTERMAIGLQPLPTNPGVSLDAAFVLNKLIASGKKNALAPVRGVW